MNLHSRSNTAFIDSPNSMFCIVSGLRKLGRYFPKRIPHRVTSSASSFRIQCLLFYVRSFSSSLRLLLRLLVPSIFTWITYCRKQFLPKMWPIQLPLPSIYCKQYRKILSFSEGKYILKSQIFLSHIDSILCTMCDPQFFYSWVCTSTR